MYLAQGYNAVTRVRIYNKVALINISILYKTGFFQDEPQAISLFFLVRNYI